MHPPKSPGRWRLKTLAGIRYALPTPPPSVKPLFEFINEPVFKLFYICFAHSLRSFDTFTLIAKFLKNPNNCSFSEISQTHPMSQSRAFTSPPSFSFLLFFPLLLLLLFPFFLSSFFPPFLIWNGESMNGILVDGVKTFEISSKQFYFTSSSIYFNPWDIVSFIFTIYYINISWYN